MNQGPKKVGVMNKKSKSKQGGYGGYELHSNRLLLKTYQMKQKLFYSLKILRVSLFQKPYLKFKLITVFFFVK